MFRFAVKKEIEDVKQHPCGLQSQEKVEFRLFVCWIWIESNELISRKKNWLHKIMNKLKMLFTALIKFYRIIFNVIKLRLSMWALNHNQVNLFSSVVLNSLKCTT